MDSRLTCPICTSPVREFVLPNATSGVMSLLRCTSCHFIYAQDTDQSPVDPTTGPTITMDDEHWMSRLAIIEQVASRGRLLNIGDGAAPFLELAQRGGWRIADLKPEGSGEFPAGVLFDEGAWPAGYFDAVTIWSGLEYDKQPTKLITLAAHYCRIDGILAMQVLNGERVHKSWSAESSPLRMFTPVSMQRFLSRFGFRTERLLLLANHRNPDMALIARYVP